MAVGLSVKRYLGTVYYVFDNKSYSVLLFIDKITITITITINTFAARNKTGAARDGTAWQALKPGKPYEEGL